MKKILAAVMAIALGWSVASADWDSAPAVPMPASQHPSWQNYAISQMGDIGQHAGHPSWPAAHGANCSAPPATHPVTTWADSRYVCANHLMTTMNIGGYGVTSVTKAELLDWSAGPATFTFDMDTRKMNNRDWFDLVVTPFTSMVGFWDTRDTTDMPKAGFELLDSGNDGISLHRFTGSGVPPAIASGPDFFNGIGLSLDGPAPNQASTRQPFRLTVSSTNVKFERLADAAVPGSSYRLMINHNFSVGFTSGMVSWAEHTYDSFTGGDFRTNKPLGCPTLSPSDPNYCLPPSWHLSGFQLTCNSLPPSARSRGEASLAVAHDLAPIPMDVGIGDGVLVPLRTVSNESRFFSHVLAGSSTADILQVSNGFQVKRVAAVDKSTASLSDMVNLKSLSGFLAIGQDVGPAVGMARLGNRLVDRVNAVAMSSMRALPRPASIGASTGVNLRPEQGNISLVHGTSIPAPCKTVTLIKSAQEYVGPGNQNVHMNAPAPANAYMQFTLLDGAGVPAISYNGGATWVNQPGNLGAGPSGEGRINAFMFPIPAGVQDIRISSPGYARDFHVWSVNGGAASTSTPTPSTPTPLPPTPSPTSTVLPTSTPTQPASTSTPVPTSTSIPSTSTPTPVAPTSTAVSSPTASPVPTATTAPVVCTKAQFKNGVLVNTGVVEACVP